MNTVRKGNKAENERIEYLRRLGYQVLPRPPRLKFKKQIDYFDFWDIVAYYPKLNQTMNGHWLLEQVKCNKSKNIKKLKKVAEFLPRNTICHLVVRIDGNNTNKVKWKEINLRE